MEAIDPRIKAATAWCGVGISKALDAVGITSWGDFAAMLASIYTAVLLADWAWKKWRGRKKRGSVS
jgi:hypothetical protein